MVGTAIEEGYEAAVQRFAGVPLAPEEECISGTRIAGVDQPQEWIHRPKRCDPAPQYKQDHGSPRDSEIQRTRELEVRYYRQYKQQEWIFE
jgi:hypothetical protein